MLREEVVVGVIEAYDLGSRVKLLERVSTGRERAGAAVRRCGESTELLRLAPSGRGPCHARMNGFDLHAAVVVPQRDRPRLERLCRYALRPPIATDRLHLTADGHVVLDLRHRWADGTTQPLFEVVELLERLAALTPRPRSILLLYTVCAGRAIGVAVTPSGARSPPLITLRPRFGMPMTIERRTEGPQ